MTIRRVQAILNHVANDDAVLDIGCVQHSIVKEEQNPDWLHGRLREISDSVVGIDILEEEIGLLRGRGYDVRVGNAETFKFNETFDKIVAGETIEHLTNPGLFLANANEHLNEGGELVLTTPNPWMFPRFVEATRDDVFVNKEHTCWFDRKTIQQLLSRTGFEIEVFDYIEPEANSIISSSNKYLISLRRLGYDLDYKAISSRTFLVVAVPNGGD